MPGARSPVQSMTGYGRGAARAGGRDVHVELRSINHRYLEIDYRMPAGLAAAQGRLAELIRERLARGRVEVSVTVQQDGRGGRHVKLDERLLAEYHQALLELRTKLGLKGPVTLDHLLRLPSAVSLPEERVTTDDLWGPMQQAAKDALAELVRTRRREGARLATDLRRQVAVIERALRAVKRRAPRALRAQRAQLAARIRELLGAKGSRTVPQLQEVAALVRETDINEEMVRLESHLAHLRQTLAQGRLVGRQLDFIAQELTRETNTLGAKVDDPEASKDVVDIKGAIERIREQAQNLE
ncbi:MAG TPA: YicC/YloC family endoribonuclease [bacterium]